MEERNIEAFVPKRLNLKILFLRFEVKSKKLKKN